MKFSWDENKEKINKKKHGISFDSAAMVFGDPFRWEDFDEEHSEEEDRFVTIGFAGDVLTVLFVVYTPGDDTIRIISARKANQKERSLYEYHRERY